MFKRSFALVVLIGALAGFVSAQERADGDKPNKVDKAQPKAPSLDEIATIVRPMLATLDLTDEQKQKANAAMTDDAWTATLKTFGKRRGGEIRQSTHKTVPEVMPTIMMPKMMKYNMQKIMKERMAKKAGPPTPEEIAAIRAANQERMRVKIAPAIMANVGELTAKRVEELLLDKQVLVRVLADNVAAAALAEEQTEKLDKVLTDAGYPAELTHGPDRVLEERVHKMLETLAEEAIAEMKEADGNAGKGKKEKPNK